MAQINLTCEKNCDLFDAITNQCSIKTGVKVNDPNTLICCNNFLPNKELFSSKSYLEENLLNKDTEFNFEIRGDDKNLDFSLYPFQPDRPSNRQDTIWYVSPCKSYGCWIINHNKKKFISIPKSNTVEIGWSNKVYKSPYPLHNHSASLSLASRIAWYVDEDGFGQYVLLINGEISTLSARKPYDWGKVKR